MIVRQICTVHVIIFEEGCWLDTDHSIIVGTDIPHCSSSKLYGLDPPASIYPPLPPPLVVRYSIRLLLEHFSV